MTWSEIKHAKTQAERLITHQGYAWLREIKIGFDLLNNSYKLHVVVDNEADINSAKLVMTHVCQYFGPIEFSSVA